MTAFEMATKYYPNLWDKDRLQQLLAANKITQEEYNTLVKG